MKMKLLSVLFACISIVQNPNYNPITRYDVNEDTCSPKSGLNFSVTDVKEITVPQASDVPPKKKPEYIEVN